MSAGNGESAELDVLVTPWRSRDDRGVLGVIERPAVGFYVARVFWLTHLSPDRPRGFHAHFRTRQLAVCLTGSCRMLLCSPSGDEAWIELTENGEGVRIEPMMWHEMHDFSVDCTLIVLADRAYDEADYIRDKSDWERARRG